MSETHCRKKDFSELFHIGSSVKRHSSVVDSVCDARQNKFGSIPSRAEFVTAALLESSLQGTSIDLQIALTLLLSRMDKMESNIANVTKTNNLLHERITALEQYKVSLHPDSSVSREYQGDDLGEEVRPSSEELRPVRTEIDLIVGEVVGDQAEAMSTGMYSLIAGLFNLQYLRHMVTYHHIPLLRV